jgi:hypothetical protein
LTTSKTRKREMDAERDIMREEGIQSKPLRFFGFEPASGFACLHHSFKTPKRVMHVRAWHECSNVEWKKHNNHENGLGAGSNGSAKASMEKVVWADVGTLAMLQKLRCLQSVASSIPGKIARGMLSNLVWGPGRPLLYVWMKVIAADSDSHPGAELSIAGRTWLERWSMIKVDDSRSAYDVLKEVEESRQDVIRMCSSGWGKEYGVFEMEDGGLHFKDLRDRQTVMAITDGGFREEGDRVYRKRKKEDMCSPGHCMTFVSVSR